MFSSSYIHECVWYLFFCIFRSFVRLFACFCWYFFSIFVSLSQCDRIRCLVFAIIVALRCLLLLLSLLLIPHLSGDTFFYFSFAYFFSTLFAFFIDVFFSIQFVLNYRCYSARLLRFIVMLLIASSLLYEHNNSVSVWTTTTTTTTAEKRRTAMI